MDAFLALFNATPVYSFLETLSSGGPLGQLLTVPLIMLLTALAVALPILLVGAVVLGVKRVCRKREEDV